jgi:hypothetical protein
MSNCLISHLLKIHGMFCAGHGPIQFGGVCFEENSMKTLTFMAFGSMEEDIALQ